MTEKPFASADMGKLLLRLSVGGLMLFHGVHKLIHGHEGVRGLLAKKGLPEWLAYGVPVGEVLAPLLIIAGLFARPAGLVVAFTMAMAMYLARGGSAFGRNSHGALNSELELLFLLGGIAIFFLGSGSMSARRGSGRWD